MSSTALLHHSLQQKSENSGFLPLFHQKMEPISVCSRNSVGPSPLSFFSTFNHNNISTHSYLNLSTSSSSSSSYRLRCSNNGGKNVDTNDDEPLTLSRAYGLLGVTPQCSSAQIKAAFRTKVSNNLHAPFSSISIFYFSFWSFGCYRS